MERTYAESENAFPIGPGVIFKDSDASYSKPLFIADLVISENHGIEIEATTYPVDKGVDMGDHLRKTPDSLTVEVFLTSSAMIENPNISWSKENAEAIAAQAKTEWMDKIADALTKLSKLATEGSDGERLFRVATSLKVYRNMAIVNVNLVRDNGGERSQKIVIKFFELLTQNREITVATQRIREISVLSKPKPKQQAEVQKPMTKEAGQAQLKTLNEEKPTSALAFLKKLLISG